MGPLPTTPPGPTTGPPNLWLGTALSGAYAASTADVTVSGTYTNDAIGGRVAAAGDINQDGYDDILAAGLTSDDYATDAGKVLYVHGPVTGRTPFEWYGEGSSYNLGTGMVAIGDQDFDGYPEYALGTPRGLTTYGEIYVRDGGAQR